MNAMDINGASTHCLCLDVRVREVDQETNDRDRLTNIRCVVCVSQDTKDRSSAHAHASLSGSLLRPAVNAARLSRDAKRLESSTCRDNRSCGRALAPERRKQAGPREGASV